MKRIPFACLVLFGTLAGLLGPAGDARPASPEARARAALALAQAAARVKAPAAEPLPAPAAGPDGTAKRCPCSNLCTCGCVQGRPCTCGCIQAAPLPAARPFVPAFAPPVVPVRRGGGGC